MRLSLELLLCVGSLGLLGQAGAWIYQANDRLGAPAASELTVQGQKTAVDRVAAGKGLGPSRVSWAYDHAAWWSLFVTANFVGKLAPLPTEVDGSDHRQQGEVGVPPLEECVELVTLMFDGEGSRTHVVVRYKVSANVKPPADVLRRMQTAVPIAPVHDVVPPAGKKDGSRPQASKIGSAPVRPTTGLPISNAAREYTQEVKVGESLWVPFSDVTLVAVSPDAESATFRRKVPGSSPGDAPTERVDKLGRIEIDHRDFEEFRWAEGRWSTPGGMGSSAANRIKWVDTEETVKIDDVWHIGRRDVTNANGDRDALLEGVHFESYQSSIGSGLRGVRVAAIEPDLSRRYGVEPGDILLDINGETVRSRADAHQVGKQQYHRGVRTFELRFLTNGRVITRTYRTPDD